MLRGIEPSWNRDEIHSNSTRTCPPWTKSPTLALILAILPAMGAVMTVSIFIASRTIRTSLTLMVWPTWMGILATVPAIGLRHTLASSATEGGPACVGGAVGGEDAGTRAWPTGGT